MVKAVPNTVSLLHNFFDTQALKAAYHLDTWQDFQGDILAYLKKLFNEYLKHIGKTWNIALPGDKAPAMIFKKCVKVAKTDASKLSEAIVDALELYLHGSVYQAQERLFSTLDETITLNQVVGELEFDDQANRLFRIRVSDDTSKIQARKDIFHVPFSLRHQIGTNRFSIPGYPCLYFSSSIYTCWEEMGRPPFHKIMLARFASRSKGTQPILYLNVAPLQWRELLEDRIQTQKPLSSSAFNGFTTYLIHWPLQLACAIPVRKHGAIFHEEYIIPQMLMQWARSNQKIHGLCFRTTHVPQMPKQRITPKLLSNLAFPARSTEQDYCPKLTEQFLLTEPQSFELSLAYHRRSEENSNPRTPTINGFGGETSMPFSLSTLSQGYYSYYGHSDFFKVELNTLYDKVESL